MFVSPNSESSPVVFPRRVSFDLSHNVVYLLPTIEECKAAAKERLREEWQRRSLNEDMLSEDIIVEIQEEWSSSSRDSDEEVDTAIIPIKSCLKKQPAPTTLPVKNHKKRKTQHKKKKKAF